MLEHMARPLRLEFGCNFHFSKRSPADLSPVQVNDYFEYLVIERHGDSEQSGDFGYWETSHVS